jgi:hypothetical protein
MRLVDVDVDVTDTNHHDPHGELARGERIDDGFVAHHAGSGEQLREQLGVGTS